MILDTAHPTSATPARDARRSVPPRRRAPPRALALIDPPNREHFTDGAPRRLTYAQADRAISAIAARLRALGLPTDAVVALQLPNTVEGVLALLGVLRAGMIAAPLPLLWHRHDVDGRAARHRRQGDPHLRARWRDGAGRDRHAGCGRAVFDPPCLRLRREPARRRGAARRRLHRRGRSCRRDRAPRRSRRAYRRCHLRRHRRRHRADGAQSSSAHRRRLRPLLPKPGSTQDAAILSTIPLGSFAGMALTLVPWLLSGGTLTLHHSFDARRFRRDRRTQQYDAVVLPARRWRRLPRPACSTRRRLCWRCGARPSAWPQRQPWHGRHGARRCCELRRDRSRRGAARGRRQSGAACAWAIARRTPPMRAGDRDRAQPGRHADAARRDGAGARPFRSAPSRIRALTAAGFIDTGHPCRFAADGAR